MPTSSNNVISSLFSVSGKNVLITGGSRGIGLMIAQTFVAAGANVLLTSRNEQACKDAVQSISDSNSNSNDTAIQYVASNVSNREGCEELAEYTSKVFNNKLDVLINNAGTSWGEPIERRSGEKVNWGFDKVFDLNVKGTFYLTRACIPMLENASSLSSNIKEDVGAGGGPSRVINIGSVAGIVPQSAPTHAYDASKAAVHQLTKKLANDLATKNITVNALAPGFVATRMSKGLQTWGGTVDVLQKSIPLKRLGNGEDMAGACIYLSSKAGSYLTGVILNVDGGSVGCLQIDLTSNL